MSINSGRRKRMKTKILSLLLIPALLLGLLSCGRSEKAEPKVKANSPPVITSITLLPERPTYGSDLTVNVQSQDPDRDNVTYRYQWMRNDEEMVGEDSYILKSGKFHKGDLIRVVVAPHDGKVEGKSVSSAPRRIMNTPPIIQEVRIEPKLASRRDPLKVHVKGFDADGDSVYYIYRWERNGAVLKEEEKEILDQSRFEKGDSITVIVTPDDRESLGTPKKSESVLISNSPPIIISSPPTSIEGTRYLYEVKAIDADKDLITFTLKSGPKGMEIDKQNGLIQWEIRKEDKGTYTIEIEASDSEGAKSIQQYTLAVEYKQS